VRSRSFAEFRLDPANQQLWRGESLLALSPKALAVLEYLSDWPGRLVTKHELLETIWPKTNVTEGVLAACVYEIRRVLGDPSRAPRFIETVHTRGYRFLPKVAVSVTPGLSNQSDETRSRGGWLAWDHPTSGRSAGLFGRQRELEELERIFEEALDGARQIVFVTGEPGIGKTALVDDFIARVCSSQQTAFVGRGQCIDHYGAGEPYLPILAAIGQLCRSPRGDAIISSLKRYAPSWLMSMSGLLSPGEVSVLQQHAPGLNRERMLREMTDALEAITVEHPLALWLEDLHWSDHATLDLIAFLARSRPAAKFLLIGTYRPVDLIVKGHPLRTLKHELQVHGQCGELQLGGIHPAAITDYLAARFPHNRFASSLGQILYDRTEGNPLFLNNVIEDWTLRGVLKQGNNGAWTAADDSEQRIPESLRYMLERQIDQLSADERALLEAASIAGMEFSPAAVAAGLATNLEEIEQRCEDLARKHQYVRRLSAAPSERPITYYVFLHALNRRVWEEQIPATRLSRLHLRIGTYKEAQYGARGDEIAAELAYHYGRCGNSDKTLRYLELAAQQAIGRRAFREAEQHYRNGLAALQRLPESPERDGRELKLRESLVLMLRLTRGWAASETVEAAARTGLLAERSGNLGRLALSVGTRSFHSCLAGDLSIAAALADEALELALREGEPSLIGGLQTIQLIVHCYWGDLAGAENHFAAGLKFFDDSGFRQEDPGGRAISVFGWASLNAWLLGRADVARARLAKMRTVVRPTNPHDLPWADILAARLLAPMRENETVEALAAHALDLCEQHGFPNEAATSRCLLGHARARLDLAADGIALIREGIDTLVQIGNRVGVPMYMTFLADGQLRAGAIGDALETVKQALNFNPEETVYRPETLRLRGEIRLKQGNLKMAEVDFRESIAMARSMGGKAWELRTTMSLARLLHGKRRRDEARTMLTGIYEWFTEGFDTADLKDAKALLEQLAG
jgi:DNA-binding winged helix-turn-helix (wHTH) protein